MPELPEVETVLKGIAPHLAGRVITDVVIRAAKLRFPLQADLPAILNGQRINRLGRRGKYLLFSCDRGTILLHLGMTGFLKVVPATAPTGRFDHVELLLDNGRSLRFSDPRKFGTFLWLTGDPLQHPLLAGQGLEPLSEEFSAEYLRKIASRRSVAIKLLIMNSKLIVGIGNIYANEALFRAGIDPAKPAKELILPELERLVAAIRHVLADAVGRGEKSLGRFIDPDSDPGYFPLDLMAYGRGGKLCRVCSVMMQESRLGNRSTVWCPECQK